MSTIFNPYRNTPSSSNIATGTKVAYSLRYVSSDYTGDVILVRRSGDDVEEGFTPTEVSDGTLASWTNEGSGDGNAYVKTWYDQSGNANNATQTGTSNQCQIVNSGTVYTDAGGKPIIRFVHSNDWWNLDSTFDLNGATWTSFTHMTRTTISSNMYMGGGNSFSGHLGGAMITNKLYIWKGTDNTYFGTTGTFSNSGSMLITSLCPDDHANAEIRVNGVDYAGTTTNNATTDVTFRYIGRRGTNYNPIGNEISEVLIFDSDKSAEYSTIENDMNDYYSVYL